MLENLEGSESELRNQEQENTFSLRNDIIHLLSAFRHNNCQNNDVLFTVYLMSSLKAHKS